MPLDVIFTETGEQSGTDGGGVVLLPPEVRAGDLVVLTVTRGASSDPVLQEVAKGDWNPLDRIMLWYPPEGSLQWDPFVHVYTGFLPDTYAYPGSAQVQVTVSNSGFGFLWAGYVLTVYRGVAAINDVAAIGSQYPIVNPVVLDVSGVLDETAEVEAAHLSMVMFNYGTVGGNINADTADPPRWTPAGGGPFGKVAARHTYTAPVVPEPLQPGIFLMGGSDPVYGILILTFTLTNDDRATRQYPRDSRGLAAAPRIFPPPRTNRLVGGHL